METSFQDTATDRQPVAAGRFYSADKETLTKDLSNLFASCRKIEADGEVRAVISPHAGYIYSGKMAATAFSVVPPEKVYSNVFLIGSSHVISFEGASVYNTGDYITPLGRVKVNLEIANKLISENSVFRFPTKAHIQEHSLEVQLPFLQYHMKKMPPIVPIIIGTDDTRIIRMIADALKPWFTDDNLFVISSDFSHYPSYKDAVETDRLTAESIATGIPQTFLTMLKKNSQRGISGLATPMCGWTSGLALLYLTEGNKTLETKLLDYNNSGDSPYGNKIEVVGYNAMAVFGKAPQPDASKAFESEFTFTGKETETLFDIARNSISARLKGVKNPPIDESKITANLMKPYGAFVTLRVDGALRGCIGRFVSSDPLYKVVEASAISSAFEDPRFNPLTQKEFDRINVEITVLGPLKRIKDKNEIVLGKHGIYIKKDFRSGTMLPQVATENKWTVDEFLGFTSREKAGIGWDGWKDAELYVYEGKVLEDHRK